MPKIETITGDLGEPLDIINISASIGANGVNDFNDIRVVKALFHYVPKYHSVTGANKIKCVEMGMGKASSWNISQNLIPSAHDGTTWGLAELTRSFQKYANAKLSVYGYQVSVSGTMKPAKGHAVVGKKFSTIAALNIFAALGIHRPEKSHVDIIVESYQDIFGYISDDRQMQKRNS